MTTYTATRGAIPLSSYDRPAASAGQSPSIAPAQLLAMLRHRRRLIALSMILGTLGGVVVIARTEPNYVATAQVIIDPRALRVVEREVTPSIDNADAQIASVENEMRVLRSSTVLNALITRDRLDEDPEFAGEPPGLLLRAKAAILGLVGLSPPRSPDPRRAALQTLERKIAVRRAERSFVVEVHVATRDPDKSARIANELVTLYTEQANRTRSELARRSGASLDDRLAELRAAVRAAENRVATFRSEHDLVSADGALTRDRRLRDLNTQLAAARARSTEALVRMEQANALRGRLDGLSEAVQSQAMIQLRYQITEARRRRANLANVLGPRHPELNSIGREIDALQDQLGQELQRIGDAARNDYRRAKQTEEELRRTVETMSTASLADDRALAELRAREAEAEAQRKLFAQYLVRSRELIEQTQVDVNNIRVIGAAIPPELPTNLSKAIVLVLGTLIGLALGILAAIALGVLRGEAASLPRYPVGSGEAVIA
ncbi:MAG: GumC family protein [Methylobacteriaceae bacterium]|jgi:succinoglycan biosynthesis transport protein ExoP